MGGNDHDCHCGTVFKWHPATDTFTVLHTFVRAEGGQSVSSLLLIGDVLYGTLSSDGPTLGGQPFSVNIDGSNFTTYTPDEGNTFRGGLTADASGNLWGVVAGGGTKNGGGIYRITLAGTYEWRIGFTEASYPIGKLLLGADGLLYGTTYGGGKFGSGSIFSYDPVANDIKRLFSFHPFYDGSSPTGGLVQDAGGALYGTAAGGGQLGYGVIYKFVP